MIFDMITDTPVTIDGKTHMVRFENGISGIGSRSFYIDGEEFPYQAVRQTADLSKGNHFLYRMKWRDTPWDWVYIFIAENELPALLEGSQKWREPQKINL